MSDNTPMAAAFSIYEKSFDEMEGFKTKVVKLESEIKGLNIKLDVLTKKDDELKKAIHTAEKEAKCNHRAAEDAEDSAKRQEKRETVHRDRELACQVATTGILIGGLVTVPITGKCL